MLLLYMLNRIFPSRKKKNKKFPSPLFTTLRSPHRTHQTQLSFSPTRLAVNAKYCFTYTFKLSWVGLKILMGFGRALIGIFFDF